MRVRNLPRGRRVQRSAGIGLIVFSAAAAADTTTSEESRARNRKLVVHEPPKTGLIALRSATNRWYVVKCVSQKRNRSNTTFFKFKSVY